LCVIFTVFIIKYLTHLRAPHAVPRVHLTLSGAHSQHTLDRDCSSNGPLCTVKASFGLFKELVLAHSVERPPRTTKIFDVEDVAKVVEYMLNSYFRHYSLCVRAECVCVCPACVCPFRAPHALSPTPLCARKVPVHLHEEAASDAAPGAAARRRGPACAPAPRRGIAAERIGARRG